MEIVSYGSQVAQDSTQGRERTKPSMSGGKPQEAILRRLTGGCGKRVARSGQMLRGSDPPRRGVYRRAVQLTEKCNHLDYSYGNW